MIGLIERILGHIGVHPGHDQGDDEARLADMERRLAAIDAKIALRVRRERERLRLLQSQDAEEREAERGTR